MHKTLWFIDFKWTWSFDDRRDSKISFIFLLDTLDGWIHGILYMTCLTDLNISFKHWNPINFWCFEMSRGIQVPRHSFKGFMSTLAKIRRKELKLRAISLHSVFCEFRIMVHKSFFAPIKREDECRDKTAFSTQRKSWRMQRSEWSISLVTTEAESC